MLFFKSHLSRLLSVFGLGASQKDAVHHIEQGEGSVQSRATPRNRRESTDYEFGQLLDGVISGITYYGIFVNLPNGESGLVPKSEVSWLGQPNNYKHGQRVRVNVGKFRPGVGLSLSIKRAETANAFNEFLLSEKPDSSHTGIIKTVCDYGIFVQIKPGVEGLLHNNEVVEHQCFSKSSVGQEIVVKVIAIDPEKKHISLSMSV